MTTASDAIPEQNEEPPRLSVSSLICFEQCSVRYWRQYVENEPPPVTPAMQRGTSVHKLIEDHFTAPLLTLDVLEERERALFERFLASRFNRPPLHTERKITLSLPNATIAGRIDFILSAEDGVEIVDFKTGRLAQRWNLARDLQLPLYALAVCREDDIPPASIAYTWYYMAADREERFTFSEKAAGDLVARVDRLVEGINAERWLHRPCKACWACRRTSLMFMKT